MLKGEDILFYLIFLHTQTRFFPSPSNKQEEHLIFMNFEVNNFIIKKGFKSFMFKHYNLVNYMEWEAINIWKLMFNKVTSKSNNYFFKFT